MSTAEDLGEFLDFLYEGQSGYVYSPTKNPESGHYQKYFFEWPQSRQDIVTHIITRSRTDDVYIAPAIFKGSSSAKKQWVAGAQVAWCEFDGNSGQADLGKLPEPSIKMQSSTSGHEHWYWKLSEFEADTNVIDGLNRKIAYALGADRSGWDAGQVLRPPFTKHHDSGRSVRVLHAKKSSNKLSAFKSLPDIPKDEVFEETSLKELPDVDDVVAEFKWPTDVWDLFNKVTQPTGSRSSALMRLGFHCIEMGMSNEESYVILRAADDKWKKFVNHTNRAERLLSIISRAKSQKSLQSELLLSEHVGELFYFVGDFLDTKVSVEWLYGDMLAKQGLGFISSLPGVGKSNISLRMGMHSVLSKPFLIWDPGECRIKRAAFLSYEMQRNEITKFLGDMKPSFSGEEWAVIRENLGIYPVGYSEAWDIGKNQDRVKEIVDNYEIELLIVDSLKSISSNLKEDKMDSIFHFINKDLRTERGITVWILHHNRKPAHGEAREPKDVSDLYGDVFISAHATTVLGLSTKSKRVRKVHQLKIRLAEEGDPFRIKLDNPNLDWKVIKESAEKEADDDDIKPDRKIEL